MKLKKIVSLLVTTAAAAVCGAAVLAVDAGAIKLPTPSDGDCFYYYESSGVLRPVENLYQYLKNYGSLYDAEGIQYGPISETIILDASDGNPQLSAEELSALAARTSLQRVEISVKDSESYQYTVVLKDRSKNINFFTNSSYSYALNPLLSHDTSKYGELCFSVNNPYSSTFFIRINGDLSGNGQFQQLLRAAGVDTSDRLRVYTYDNFSGDKFGKTIKVIYASDARNDLNLEFGNGINTYYYSKYDKTVLQLYNETNTYPYVYGKVLSLIGAAQSEADTNVTLANYAASVADEITGRYFTKDPTTGTYKSDDRIYLTASDIDPLIEKYYGEKGASGALTTTASGHLSDLVSFMMNYGDTQKVVDNALYGVFGWDTNNAVTDVLRKEINDVVCTNLADKNVSVSDYRTYIQYFLNEWATSTYQQLKSDLESTKSVLESRGMNYSSTADLIAALSRLSYSLGTDQYGRAYTLSQTANLVKNDPTLLTTGRIASGSTTTGGTASITANQTTVGDNSAQRYTETYVSGQGYATKSELQEEIAVLRSTLNDLQNQINVLKSTGTGTSAYSFNEWISTTSYGNIDSFVTAVADLVAKKIGSGESAYDIAVRNGFKGSEQAWLNSLVGESAYEIAVDNGYKGTEKAWLNSLTGESAYEIAVANGFKGTEQAWLESLKSGDANAEDRYVYVYGSKFNSAAPAYSETEASEQEEEITISDNETVSYNVAAVSDTRAKNPSTGAAMGILIPAGAAALLFLGKGAKRKRGRR